MKLFHITNRYMKILYFSMNILYLCVEILYPFTGIINRSLIEQFYPFKMSLNGDFISFIRTSFIFILPSRKCCIYLYN